jgi:hypothetical protein
MKAAPSLGSPKTTGDVASMCAVVERMERLENKLDDLISALKPLFSDKGMRTAIGAAILSQGMKVRQ